MAIYIDFKELRKQVSMEMLLEHYGLLSTMTIVKDGFKSSCPIHKGNPKNKSFKVNTTKNLWNCFSPKCEKGGNVLDFVVAMEDCSIREAAEKMVAWFNLDTSNKLASFSKSNSRTKTESTPKSKTQAEPKAKPKEKTETELGEGKAETKIAENKVLSFKLQKLETDHPYFQEIGLDQATVEYFGLGYYSGKGMMQNRIVIPVHNFNSELVAYIGRDPKGKKADLYPRPENYNPELDIYNLNRVKALKENEEISEIDLYFDFASLWFYYQELEAPAIVLLTETISQEQINLLDEAFKGSKPKLIIHISSGMSEAKLKEIIFDLAMAGFRIEFSALNK